MADMAPVYDALRSAHAAGDTAAAQKLAAYIQSQGAASEKQLPEQTWGQAIGTGITNLPKSLAGVAGNVLDVVTHPAATIENIADVFTGAVQNALPKSLQADSAEKQRAQANAVGQFYKERYGSEEGLKNAIAQDPASVAMDAATLLSGGGAAVSRLPILGRAGEAISAAGRTIDPLAQSVNAISASAPFVGRQAASLIGGLGTHTGAESIRQAAEAGKVGGETGTAFLQNLRGQVPMTDVLDNAKSNLEAMRQAKSQAYRAGMAQVSGDKSVLDFSGIDNAMKNAYDMATFKGVVKNVDAAKVLQNTFDAINKWKNLDPAEFHTPEGMDALKQNIGGILESIPFEQKTARNAVGNVYNAIKNEITKQAPTYADTMKDYTEASDQIKEIERALSLGNKASVDTAMRKLQSLTRSNVNTNWGNRLELAKSMEQAGGKEIMPALAGQALSSITPRGLGGAAAGAIGAAGLYAHNPLAIPILAAQSPRLMGETAYYTGKGASAVENTANILSRLAAQAGTTPQQLANAIYQARQNR